MVVEKILNNILGKEDDKIEDTLKKQMGIKEDNESEDMCGLGAKKHKWRY